MKKHINTYSFIFVLLILTFTSCKKEVEDNDIPQVINYLALGDSYTIGQGVEPWEGWPNQLSQKLVQNGYGSITTEIIAQTGWKTDDLLTAIEDVENDSYNLVSLLIGVNNQFWGQPFETFTTEFDSLLLQTIGIAGGKERVFLLSIPDYGVTPFGSNNSEAIGEDIDMYNAYIEQKCIEQEIPFIDITGISRQLGDSPGALSSDNLHPSGSQYGLWAEEALPIVLGILME